MADPSPMFHPLGRYQTWRINTLLAAAPKGLTPLGVLEPVWTAGLPGPPSTRTALQLEASPVAVLAAAILLAQDPDRIPPLEVAVV